jgi:hypothetical protein
LILWNSDSKATTQKNWNCRPISCSKISDVYNVRAKFLWKICFLEQIGTILCVLSSGRSSCRFWGFVFFREEISGFMQIRVGKILVQAVSQGATMSRLKLSLAVQIKPKLKLVFCLFWKAGSLHLLQFEGNEVARVES